MQYLLVGPEPAYLVDPATGDLVACNEMFANKVGCDRESLEGRGSLDLYAPDSRATVDGSRDEVRETDAASHAEVRMRGPDGELLDVRMSTVAVEVSQGESLFKETIHDITDLKRAQQELRERTRRLEQSNRELEQFAYLASHDLQEPLRMVASYTELLAKRYEEELDDRAQKYIDYAVEGAERMKTLLNDLLQYSRAGRAEQELEPVDLDDVLDIVEANLRVRLAEDGAVVTRGDLPVVRGAESQLVNVFQNLIDNALKFNESGDPRVRVDAERRDDRWVISVSDDGIGFDPENADRIFQVFQRLNARDDYGGTGIGLAIVKKLVENHGGELSVESEPGSGTTVTFDLEGRA